MEKPRIGNFCIARFSILGCPDDLGVKNVNGRPGASHGPSKFSEYFLKLKGEVPLLSALHRSELVPMGTDLEANLEGAARLTAERLRELDVKRDVLVTLGGGHDYAYPWIKGAVEAFGKRKRIACINIDAHFDLREYAPVMTSGSPFRRLIDEGLLDPARLVEFGIQNHCNGPELWEYARKKKIKTLPFETLRNGRAVAEFKRNLLALERKSDLILVSVDLDAMTLAVAPGVSAPQPEGFQASELFQMLEFAGARKKVVSLGIFELSPEQDFKDQTARLAAQAAWKFLRYKCFRKGRNS
jgi:formiminoglutamase